MHNNIWLVAQHEFMTNIRKRSFLFAVFGVPLLMAAIFGITFFAQIQAFEGGIVAERIGYVEQSELIELDSDMFVSYNTVGAATQALEAGEVDVFFVIPPLYISTGEVRLYSYGNVSEDTRDMIDTFIVENITASVVSDVPPERLIEPVNLDIFTENTGRELTFNSLIGLIIAPALFGIVMMMALQLTSTFLMSGVVEEKSNHIMEILITSITPYQLLTGKLIGLGALGLLQVLLWIIVGVVGLQFSGDVEFLVGVSLPPSFIFAVLAYFVLTYFLFSSLLAGIGAVIGSEQESRTYAGVVSLFVVLPFFFVSLLIINPDAPLFTYMLFFPLTSGMTYILKFPFSPIPVWQMLISLSGLLITTILVTWASARVFRWALLLYGKKPNLKTLWSVIFAQRSMDVSPAQSTEQEQIA
ncbi:MAG: ABC transporter permease [Anaerolineae bacterium]